MNALIETNLSQAGVKIKENWNNEYEELKSSDYWKNVEYLLNNKWVI